MSAIFNQFDTQPSEIEALRDLLQRSLAPTGNGYNVVAELGRYGLGMLNIASSEEILTGQV